jgi:hypothetical protein
VRLRGGGGEFWESSGPRRQRTASSPVTSCSEIPTSWMFSVVRALFTASPPDNAVRPAAVRGLPCRLSSANLLCVHANKFFDSDSAPAGPMPQYAKLIFRTPKFHFSSARYEGSELALSSARQATHVGVYAGVSGDASSSHQSSVLRYQCPPDHCGPMSMW